MQEQWKDVEGYEGMYQVSSFGRIKSLDRLDNVGRKLKGFVMKQSLTRGDYLMVSLTKNAKRKHFRVNRLVALMFIPNPNAYPHAGHYDDNKANNRIDNLYWTTAKENNTHNNKHIKVGEKVGKSIMGVRGAETVLYSSSLQAEKNGFNSSAIRNCLRGRSKTHRGYTWNYIL